MIDGHDILKACDKSFNGTERSNASPIWEDIAEFIMPSQSGNFLGQDTPGVKKTSRVFDPFAIQANQDLAAAIHSTLTNPATKWSNLRFKADDLNNDTSAVSWLQQVNKEIHSHFNESNFDTMVSKNYQGITGLGTMILFQDQKLDADIFDGFNFEAVHLAEIAIEENFEGRVDTIYRKFKLTGKQVLEKWPNADRYEVEDDPDKEYEVVFCVSPRPKKDIKLNSVGLASAKHRPYAGYYVLRKTGETLDEVGYYEFPFYVTRWQTMPSEKYGRGPGHIALPGVRSLNKLDELELRAADKAISPPIFAEEGNILSSLSLKPNTLNIVRNLDGIREYRSEARFDIAQLKAEDIKNDIKSIFFIDKLFLPPRTETGEMTAFEVDQRLAQMQRVLGPTLSRLNNEFLSPLILRSFKTLLREGQLPELPEILKQRGIDIEIGFINQLSRAQQIEELTTVDQWIRRMAEAAQVKPEILDYVDADAYAKFASKILSIPEQLVVNDDIVQQVRQQRAEQAQQQQALEAGVQAADITSKTKE